MPENLKPLTKRVVEARERLLLLSNRASSIAAEADKLFKGAARRSLQERHGGHPPTEH